MTPISARLYSYQVPVLIRNEEKYSEGEAADVWAYADACALESDAARQGDAWASFIVHEPPPAGTPAWAYGTQDEATRPAMFVDTFAAAVNEPGGLHVYVPTPFEWHAAPGGDLPPPPLLVNVGPSPAGAPARVSVGIPASMQDLLASAGLLVAAGKHEKLGDLPRVFIGPSLDEETRRRNGAGPLKLAKSWRSDRSLVCTERGESRPGDNEALAHRLMVRDPWFKRHPDGWYQCPAPTEEQLKREREQLGQNWPGQTWGGGAASLFLFPNLG